MAKDNNLTDFLTDVADAIREKKGTSEPINPQDFASEIASIESGGGEVDERVALILTNKITSLASGITSLRQYALRGCSNLKDVDLPEVSLVNSNALYGTGLTELSLPKCTKFDSSACDACASLVSVSLPILTTIGNYALRNCTSLVDVDLASCKTFGSAVLYGCTKLQKLILPACTSIGTACFQNAKLLDTVVLESDTVATLSNTNAFSGTAIANKTGYIYVPSALVESYKSASNWSTYASQIRAIEDYPEIYD